MTNGFCVPVQEVIDHWRQLERFEHPTVYKDVIILNKTFPSATKWFRAELEASDIDKLFLLKVPEFGPLSKQSWKVRPAADYFEEQYHAGTYDPDYPYNAKKMAELLKWNGRLESRMIMVSESHAGPFTILDGNHRAILLMHEKRIIGASVYLGIHFAMRYYNWMQPTYDLYQRGLLAEGATGPR